MDKPITIYFSNGWGKQLEAEELKSTRGEEKNIQDKKDESQFTRLKIKEERQKHVKFKREENRQAEGVAVHYHHVNYKYFVCLHNKGVSHLAN